MMIVGVGVGVWTSSPSIKANKPNRRRYSVCFLASFPFPYPLPFLPSFFPLYVRMGLSYSRLSLFPFPSFFHVTYHHDARNNLHMTFQLKSLSSLLCGVALPLFILMSCSTPPFFSSLLYASLNTPFCGPHAILSPRVLSSNKEPSRCSAAIPKSNNAIKLIFTLTTTPLKVAPEREGRKEGREEERRKEVGGRVFCQMRGAAIMQCLSTETRIGNAIVRGKGAGAQALFFLCFCYDSVNGHFTINLNAKKANVSKLQKQNQESSR